MSLRRPKPQIKGGSAPEEEEEEEEEISFIFSSEAAAPPGAQVLLIHEVSGSHTTTHHIRYESSGMVISSTQCLLLDNTKHSQQIDIHAAPGVIRTHDLSTGERPLTYALDRAATGTIKYR